MIVIDTSALIAILRDEPEAAIFSEAILNAERRLVAAPTALEFSIVTISRKLIVNSAASELFTRLRVTVEPWAERHLILARDAFARFGKGRGHRAQLNFGDCISYALAKAEDAPLLYKGGDFALTDVRAAI